jgi:hypothetical protein
MRMAAAHFPISEDVLAVAPGVSIIEAQLACAFAQCFSLPNREQIYLRHFQLRRRYAARIAQAATEEVGRGHVNLLHARGPEPLYAAQGPGGRIAQEEVKTEFPADVPARNRASPWREKGEIGMKASYREFKGARGFLSGPHPHSLRGSRRRARGLSRSRGRIWRSPGPRGSRSSGPQVPFGRFRS